MDLTTAQLDRACGVLLGQACGDALGVPYEFAAPPGPGVEAEMRGGGLGPYSPGEWSDDTQMTLCIAKVAATGADLTSGDALDAVAQNFLDWQERGATDVGVQTEQVLTAARSGSEGPGTRMRAAAASYSATHDPSAGNGALMRTSVVGLTALDDRAATAAAARAMAELTHADPLAVESCILWSEAIRVAVTERRLDVAAGLDLVHPDRRGLWVSWLDEAENVPPARFSPNGFTVTALQAAWAAIRHTPVPVEDTRHDQHPCQHFQEALHTAVQVGDDTDTVAAIAGALLGAYWGASAVPGTWRRRVHGWPGMRAHDLVRLAALTARGGRSGPDGWPVGALMNHPTDPCPAVRHPYDDGVWLGTADTTGPDATAVVSLCRTGHDEVPAAAGNHVDVWLVDSDDPADNPNLGFVLADTAAVVAELRAEGHSVLVHCLPAQQRTSSVALAYARRLGVRPAEARAQVLAALPYSPDSGLLWKEAAGVASAAHPDPV